MSSRQPPAWFSLENYQFMYVMTPYDWYLHLKARRESKALFDLIKNEPKLFNQSFSDECFWDSFMNKLPAEVKAQAVNIQSDFAYKERPTYINYYINYRMLPIFDLTHWHEVFDQPLPGNSEFAQWVFADLDKITRYQMNDAKKVVKRAMMECDALKYWQE